MNIDFSYLDEDEFKTKYASGLQRNQMKFYIGGIRCGKCVRKLEELPQKVQGLKNLQIEMGKNLAHIEIDGDSSTFSAIAEEIHKAGFELIPLSREASFEMLEKKEDRVDLIRLGVAGMCAGNIMTFSFANYLGATPDWEPLFAWLSFLLYLPVVTFVAWPFYRGAWLSLRQRQISIDLPMAIASLFGFVFSTVELLRDKSDIYFDSLSGFLFLILISRYTQKKLQRGFLRAAELKGNLDLQKFRKIDTNGWTWRAIESLQPGDRFLLHAPETVPAESELQSIRAQFSLAWLSGESKSRTFLRGSIVPAGSRLVSGEAQLSCKRVLSETGFGQILAEVQKFSLSRNQTVILADRWAQWLLGAVFTLALAFLVFYWSISPEEAVRRSLALIILACPCAMAFGTPLALAACLKKAQKAGLIVRDANIFEAARWVQNIFFDKTGTLTDTELSLVENPADIPSVYQKVILSLENESLHPIAFAFRKAFMTADRLPPVEGLRETTGSGVSGYVYGRYYEIKKTPFKTVNTACTLFEDEKPVASFTFRTGLKADSAPTLAELRARGYQLFLLSGDHSDAVQTLAQELGFRENEFFYGLSPSEKAEIVRKYKNTAMIGDGVNDSLALMAADVGLAVSGGVEAALKSAQIYLNDPGIKPTLKLFDLSAEAYGLIRQNLTISVIYNAIGAALALKGYVNPFVAALLMPVSSGVILLSTWWRGRS